MAEGLRALSTEQMSRLLHAKAAELESRVRGRLGSPYTTDTDWLIADVALVMGVAGEAIERLGAAVALLEAHTENLIERVYLLEGGDSGTPPTHHHQDPAIDATGYLAEQRLRENP